MEQETSLKFKFDISAFRLIGRELITDKITAVFELVKNAYDANAEHVQIEFNNTQTLSPESKIIITDDGHGMSFDDIKNKWMVIGTDSKRITKVSPAPYNRNLVGKKGIGRFAVDKLGDNLTLKTKKVDAPDTLCVENNWTNFETAEKTETPETKKYFTDIENKVWHEDAKKEQGTQLIIANLHDIWTETDIGRLYKVLSTLISPNFNPKYPFNIKIIAPETNNYKESNVYTSGLDDIATIKVNLSYDENEGLQEKLYIDKDGKLATKKVNNYSFGPIKFTLFYYDSDAKRKFHTAYPNEDFTGIKIFRDGILTTPFVETQDDLNNQKDLLGIDKRRWSGFFDKISSHDILGWIELTELNNPKIEESTNRQGFVENEEWLDLQKFVIETISIIEKIIKTEKDKIKKQTKNAFKESKTQIINIQKTLKKIKVDDPETQKNLDFIDKQLGNLTKNLNKTERDIKKTEKDKERLEELMFSLVSLQTYAGMLAHIVRTLLGKILRDAEFVSNHVNDINKSTSCKKYADLIVNNITSLDKSIDFLLRYSKDGTDFERINLKMFFSEILNEVYKTEFESRNIKAEFYVDDTLAIKYNKKALTDIFDNLISNSLKAFKDIDYEKHIKITASEEKDKLKIYYSNNGPKIKDSEKDSLFNVFYTTTAQQGGAGLGLYIVQTRLESMKGSIELIENEFKPNGVTFLLTIPYKNKEK